MTPKADKSYWLILDLRELNKHCQPKSFIHEDINSVINLIEPDDYLVTVDLKSAFYHIPVLEEHSTYLGFECHTISSLFCPWAHVLVPIFARN